MRLLGDLTVQLLQQLCALRGLLLQVVGVDFLDLDLDLELGHALAQQVDHRNGYLPGLT